MNQQKILPNSGSVVNNYDLLLGTSIVGRARYHQWLHYWPFVSPQIAYSFTFSPVITSSSFYILSQTRENRDTHISTYETYMHRPNKQTCVYAVIHSYILAYINTCTHTCIRTRTRTSIRTSRHTYIPTCMHCIPRYIHNIMCNQTYFHTYMYI